LVPGSNPGGPTRKTLLVAVSVSAEAPAGGDGATQGATRACEIVSPHRGGASRRSLATRSDRARYPRDTPRHDAIHTRLRARVEAAARARCSRLGHGPDHRRPLIQPCWARGYAGGERRTPEGGCPGPASAHERKPEPGDFRCGAVGSYGRSPSSGGVANSRSAHSGQNTTNSPTPSE
jgi:hypothetical protein